MKNINNNLRIKTKSILKLLSVLETELHDSDAELSCFIQEPCYFQKEYLKFVLIIQGMILQLWSYPTHLMEKYDFYPDQWEMSHRMFGKYAQGLSPPGLLLCILEKRTWSYTEYFKLQ